MTIGYTGALSSHLFQHWSCEPVLLDHGVKFTVEMMSVVIPLRRMIWAILRYHHDVLRNQFVGVCTRFTLGRLKGTYVINASR